MTFRPEHSGKRKVKDILKIGVGPLQAMWAFEPVVLTSRCLRTRLRFKKFW